MNRFFIAAICIGLMSIAFAVPASADTVLTYTGNPFTELLYPEGDCTDFPCTNPFTTSMSVTATIDLAGPLPVSSDVVINPVSFNVYVGGALYLASSNPDVYSSFQFITDGGGAIIGWEIVVGYPTPLYPGPELWNSEGSLGTGGDHVQTINDSRGAQGDSPGTWTQTTVPEPPPLTLLAVALPIIVIMSRRPNNAMTCKRAKERHESAPRTSDMANNSRGSQNSYVARSS